MRSTYSSLFSIIRRTTTPPPFHKTPTPLPTTPISLSNLLMNPDSGAGASLRLRNLSQQLRLYKPPPHPLDDDDEDIAERKREESTGKVVSQVGFAESATPIANLERFRPKRAAVLICLFEDEGGDLRVFLTKRSSNLSTHSGEVALPGGKAEEGDVNDVETALREAKEEIGLDPSLVNVVTVLEPFLSKHLLRVVPVVGVLSDRQLFKPVPNAAEVDTLFDVPLEMFLKDENRLSEETELIGKRLRIHIFDYKVDNKNFRIWGLTAGILIRAASVVFQRSPSFLEQIPSFIVPRYVDKDTKH